MITNQKIKNFDEKISTLQSVNPIHNSLQTLNSLQNLIQCVLIIYQSFWAIITIINTTQNIGHQSQQILLRHSQIQCHQKQIVSLLLMMKVMVNKI